MAAPQRGADTVGGMGYTQYFSYRPDDPQWRAAWPELLGDTRRIIDWCAQEGIVVAGGLGEGDPQIGPDAISLNGAGDEGVETLYIAGPDEVQELERSRGMHHRDYVFGYCKTNRMPYDSAAAAVLLRAAQLAPESFLVGSDGLWEEEWCDGAGDDGIGARQITGQLFGDDELPELAREFFFDDTEAEVLFARVLQQRRTALMNPPDDTTPVPLAETLFADPDSPGLGR